jgi:hypothetical protein
MSTQLAFGWSLPRRLAAVCEHQEHRQRSEALCSRVSFCGLVSYFCGMTPLPNIAARERLPQACRTNQLRSLKWYSLHQQCTSAAVADVGPFCWLVRSPHSQLASSTLWAEHDHHQHTQLLAIEDKVCLLLQYALPCMPIPAVRARSPNLACTTPTSLFLASMSSPVSRSAAIASLQVSRSIPFGIDGSVDSHLHARGCGRLWWLSPPIKSSRDE